MGNYWTSMLDRGNRMCKGPEAGACLVFLQNTKTYMTGEE